MKEVLSALFFSFFLPLTSGLAIPTISLLPTDTVFQGEPVMVTLENVRDLKDITSITFDGQTLNFFLYQGKPTTFIGIDLNARIGPHQLLVTFNNKNKEVTTKDIIVNLRPKPVIPLGIPAKLGGNTLASQTKLVASLQKENKIISNSLATTSREMLWRDAFISPLRTALVVTDPYGYNRQTGAYLISHKGTDFRAGLGLAVLAMNRGIVTLAEPSVIYGNMIIIDHGLGLSTLYAHLSEIKVKTGDIVTQGQVIGASGATGYAEAPHLHISIRINGVSIDPMKFLTFFNQPYES